MEAVPTAPVIRDFAKHVGDRPQIDPDVIETLVEFKESYFSDPNPARWTVDIVQELLLDVLPRGVAAPDDWFAAVAPTTRAYVEFLQSRGRLAPGSDSATALLSAIDRLAGRVLAASQDPCNSGMPKAVLSTVGFDPSLGGAGPLSGGPLAVSTGQLCLPAIWLPPPAELAAAVRQAPLVRDLLRLATWSGTRHTVTRRQVLPLADARRACADLGLPVPQRRLGSAARIPALHRLWILALDTELLQIDRGAAVPGEAADLLTSPGPDPDAVVSWWLQLLDTCLVDGLDLTENFDEDDEDDVLDTVDEVWDVVDEVLRPVLVELYPGDQILQADLEKGILDAVEETIADLPASDLSPHQVRTQAQRRWTAHLDQLAELGVAVFDDGQMRLSPLGQAGVRAIALDDGAAAPVIDDPATLDASALLRTLQPLGRSAGEPVLAAWSGVRTTAQAIGEILEAARAGTAGTRLFAAAVLTETFGDHLRGVARHQLEALRDDPVLGAYAHALLTEPGQPVQFPPHLQQWVALETVAAALDDGAFDAPDRAGCEDALTTLWQIIEQDADLDSAWTSSHPQLIDVLEAVAAHHPKGRIRKAAKKALFKTRNQRPPSPPTR
jgi:hypothetical protein